MRSVRIMAVAAAAIAVTAGAAGAQVPGVGGVGIEFGGIYATLSGNDFQGVNAGLGGDAQIRFGGRFSVGVGGQFTSHGNDLNSDKFKVLGIFAEPRITFQVPASPVTPFVGARVGYLRSSITSGGSDITSSGYVLGGTGGVMFRAAPKIKIVIAAVFASVKFGDQDVNGTTQPNSDVSGTSLAIRAGLNISL